MIFFNANNLQSHKPPTIRRVQKSEQFLRNQSVNITNVIVSVPKCKIFRISANKRSKKDSTLNAGSKPKDKSYKIFLTKICYEFYLSSGGLISPLQWGFHFPRSE